MDNEANTLMNSIGLLQDKANQLDDLARMSQKMVDKFNRVDDIQKKEAIQMGNNIADSKSQSNIVDLFNGKSDQIGRSINIIGNNLEVIINMIG